MPKRYRKLRGDTAYSPFAARTGLRARQRRHVRVLRGAGLAALALAAVLLVRQTVFRGGQPDAQDRIFATQCGVEAALSCLKGKYGVMIAQVNGKMCRVPLEDVAGKLKYVDPKGDLVKEAKALGISFGDE